ncbi:hypothetical protein [Poriferisphaera sp. WC338]|uniref:hypothetical protein n=1 Tax=Poriferisphaera sp. WC338 TaxID=3425129 RepID=UPI003D81961E
MGRGVTEEVEPKVWAWREAWQSDYVEMGRVITTIRPRQEQVTTAEQGGRLVIERSLLDSEAVVKGQVWGRISPERLELERRLLDIKQETLVLQERLLEEIESPKAQIEIEKTRDEAKKLRDALVHLKKNAEQSELLKKLLPGAASRLDSVSLELAERVYGLAEKQATDGSGTIKLDRLRFEEGRIELEKAETEFAQRERQSWLIAAFDGELKLAIADKTWQQLHDEPAEIKQGDRISVLRDQSILLLEVRLKNVNSQFTDPVQLYARFKLQGKEIVEAKYYDQIVEEDTEGRTQVVMRYVVGDVNTERLRQMVGMQLAVGLRRQLTKRVYVVPKSILLSEKAGVFNGSDWDAGVQKTWPGAKVIAVGPYHVAIDRGGS